jgi:hypothetical protein
MWRLNTAPGPAAFATSYSVVRRWTAADLQQEDHPATRRVGGRHRPSVRLGDLADDAASALLRGDVAEVEHPFLSVEVRDDRIVPP